MLNAFDLMTGQVRWRLTSVGISKVQIGPQGNLYVDTTTASPDSIQFSQQIDIFKKAQPVVMKVDPKTGKVLWRVERIAKDCFLSGKFVYASMSSSDPMAALNLSRTDRALLQSLPAEPVERQSAMALLPVKMAGSMLMRKATGFCCIFRTNCRS